MAPLLPEQSGERRGKPTLVLDVDETLVHVDPFVDIDCDDDPTPFMIKRPGVDKFLRDMFEAYELVVFSGANRAYVDYIVDALDPRGDLIAYRLYGDDVDVDEEGRSFKDLRQLGRDLDRVVWLDDSPKLYEFTPKNGIQVPEFMGDEDDKVLHILTPHMFKIAKSKQVQRPIRSLKKKIQSCNN